MNKLYILCISFAIRPNLFLFYLILYITVNTKFNDIRNDKSCIHIFRLNSFLCICLFLHPYYLYFIFVTLYLVLDHNKVVMSYGKFNDSFINIKKIITYIL